MVFFFFFFLVSLSEYVEGFDWIWVRSLPLLDTYRFMFGNRLSVCVSLVFPTCCLYLSYMCVCIFVCVCMCMYRYVWRDKYHSWVFTHMHAHTALTHSCLDNSLHTYTYMCVYTYVHVSICVCMHMPMNTYVRRHACIHAYLAVGGWGV